MTCVVHGRTLAWYASASARLSLALGVVFVLNMLAAAPPAPEVRPILPIDGPLGIAGSLAMLTITGVTMVLLLRPTASLAQDHRVGAVPEAAGL